MLTNDGSLYRVLQRGISRRHLVHQGIGAAVLGSGIWTPAQADDLDKGEGQCGQPLPIPYTHPTPTGQPIHHYFPGPITGVAAATDPFGTHPEGRDPSLITNFRGMVGEVDATFSGTGMDTKTGAKANYTFHTDTRFMIGDFVASDEELHSGAFAFIWVDSITVSPLGPHSYDPGISPTLLTWTVPIPKGNVQVDMDSGHAILRLENVSSVFDAFTVPNSFDVHHALGFVGAVINSFHIEWSGVSAKRSFNNGSTFRATSVESVSAPIQVTTTTPATKPPFTPTAQDGFTFTSDPKTTVTNFAQIVQEANGALY